MNATQFAVYESEVESGEGRYDADSLLGFAMSIEEAREMAAGHNAVVIESDHQPGDKRPNGNVVETKS